MFAYYEIVNTTLDLNNSVIMSFTKIIDEHERQNCTELTFNIMAVGRHGIRNETLNITEIYPSGKLVFKVSIHY